MEVVSQMGMVRMSVCEAGGREEDREEEMCVGLMEVSALLSLRLCSPMALGLMGYLSGQVCWEQCLFPSFSPQGYCPVPCQPLYVKPHPYSLMYLEKDPHYIHP